MSKFVITENLNPHIKAFSNTCQKDIDAVYHEEMELLKNSKIFIFKNELDELIGTIRVLRWDFISPLPIQKSYGVNPFLCIEGEAINDIWHIGRLAIKKGIQDTNLLKKLLVCAIAPVCAHKDNIAFAEIDAEMLRVLRLLGIKAKTVGKSREYLGCDNIPVSISYHGLIDFYNENKHMVSTQKNIVLSGENYKLPNKVVFSTDTLNYTLV